MATKPTEWAGQERRGAAPVGIDLILHRLTKIEEGLAEGRVELQGAMREMAKAITQLALTDAEVKHVGGALERAFVALEKVERRVETLESAAPLNNQARTWMFKGLLASAGAALTYIGIKTGLILK